jgi:hypothetical protein
LSDAAMRPASPGIPARNLSLGVISVCEVGPAIRIGCVGLQEPSGLEKKFAQLGAARVGELPSAAKAQPIALAIKIFRRRMTVLTASIDASEVKFELGSSLTADAVV